MRKEESIVNGIDWVSVLIYATLVLLGWGNVFASVYVESLNQSMWDLKINSGRQMMFIGISIILIIGILAVDMRFFEAIAYLVYGLILFMVLLVPFIGK